MIDSVAPDRAKHTRCRGISGRWGFGIGRRLVLGAGRLFKEIAETLKLVEDHQIGSDLLECGNRERASHGGNQFKAVVRVDEILYSRWQMLPVLYAQLDTQRMTKCSSERSIGDFPVPDRCPVMSKPAIEPLSPHIHTKGPVKAGYRSWQEFLEERKPERTFLDTPLASSAPS